MIACFVEENHENWDRFLHEFAFALRISVNETTSRTPAELFLGRKITPFSKLINVTEGAEHVGRNIEKLFVEARQNMRKQHKTWEKYHKWKRREVNIKVNDLVLVQTHFMSAAGRRVVGKFMPKFEGPYRVLEDRNSNLIIWKKGKSVTVNIDQGSQSIAGPSHQIDTRQGKPPTEGNRQGANVQYDRARETRTTSSGGNREAERRPIRFRQATAVRPSPYYLRSRVKQPEGIPEEQRSNEIDSIPQNNLRRRSISMEALDADPVDRSE
ncbi:uncharacterized protein TNCV_2583541 [Trichonephila clavipes]|nr:uncharacterized protein TNCV_2583541 [Trichonephila clavipes]